MSDQRDGQEAGVPEDGAFDGDASSERIDAGIAPGGSEGAAPEGDGSPPVDGGVVGGTGEDDAPVGDSFGAGITDAKPLT